MDCIKSVSWDRCLIPSTDYERVDVQLIMSALKFFLVGKCKIAPQRQTLTISKLELIAACLCDWRFCPTQFNVADVGTRVLLPSSIERLSSWIEGPEFLRKVSCKIK